VVLKNPTDAEWMLKTLTATLQVVRKKQRDFAIVPQSK
jgi:hypothetical protein